MCRCLRCRRVPAFVGGHLDAGRQERPFHVLFDWRRKPPVAWTRAAVNPGDERSGLRRGAGAFGAVVLDSSLGDFPSGGCAFAIRQRIPGDRGRHRADMAHGFGADLHRTEGALSVRHHGLHDGVRDHLRIGAEGDRGGVGLHRLDSLRLPLSLPVLDAGAGNGVGGDNR